MIPFLVITICLCFAGWWLWQRAKILAIRSMDAAWLPAELAGATLRYSERKFFTQSPFPLVARIDRGYMTSTHGIVLVDFKRRRLKRTYLSDIVEISAQRVAMIGAGVKKVAMHAYVVVIDPETNWKTAIRIQLENEASIAKRHVRYRAIRNGAVKPNHTTQRRMCDFCGHSEYCEGFLR